MTIEQMAARMHQRIGQFIFNALQEFNPDLDLFYVENDRLYQICAEYYHKHTN